MFRKSLLIAMAVLSLTGNSVQAAGDDWYPSSITMPEGLQYPCALTALPKALGGIPEADRKYINHAYAMILKCVQAKTVMLSRLGGPGATDASSAYAKYYYDTSQAIDKLRKEPTPSGLETFRNQVLTALNMQVTFFKKATDERKAGKSFNDIMNIPEGHQASGQLQAAWGQMASRYPTWSNDTKDSIYHHLCALDLF